MKIAIMQPYFFPYIGYFQLIEAVDKVILYDYVHYIKKGWIKRNRILEKNRGPRWIEAPVLKESSHKRIYEVKIDTGSDWQRSILKLLEHNYKKAIGYQEVMPALLPLFEHTFTHLAAFNFESIRTVVGLLGISTSIEYGSGHFLEIETEIEDFPPASERRNQRIWKICQKERADTYINPIGGTELYNKGLFSQEGFSLLFLKTGEYCYPQTVQQFIPHLSIIDVLFNCGIQGTKTLLTNYQLV